MKKGLLHVSDDLWLPQTTVTSTGVVYGGKGMGKSNLLAVIMEELARARLHFSALDAMGVLWGIRHDVSGKGPGIEVLILGGIHGDIPIEPTGGAVVADLVTDEDVSVVIDISRRRDGSMWSIAERVRFVTDYCKRLYQRQGEQRRPILQLIDEAARFAPQVVRSGDMEVAACMGAIAVLVEEGRNVGIGCWLFTQRSARLNKDVAELADAMIALRTGGPNSVRAVLDWLGEHVDKDKLKDYGAKLRTLPIGSGLVVSPGWLQFEGIAPFRARTTFDSSATPKPGAALKKVSGGAKPDLAKYAARMAETIERAKATDPKALQAKVKELEAQVKKLQAAKAPAAKVETKEVYVLKDGQLKRIEALLGRGEKIGDAIRLGMIALAETVAPAMARAQPMRPAGAPPRLPTPAPSVARIPALRAVSAPRVSGQPLHQGSLGKGQMRMLVALGRTHPRPQTRDQLGVLSGYSSSAGTFTTYLPQLKRAGLVDENGDALSLTHEGLALVGDSAGVARSPEDVRSMWKNAPKMGGGEWRMMEVLLAADGTPMSRQELGERSGYSHEAGTFTTYLPRLKRMGIVLEGRDGVRAAPELLG